MTPVTHRDQIPNDGGTTEGHTLRAEGLRLAYDRLEVVSDLSVSIPPGRITVIVGANAC